jgi:hypothetical protein
VIINCVSQDLFSRKPCWKSANILWVSRCSMICLKIICSIILHGTDGNIIVNITLNVFGDLKKMKFVWNVLIV